MKQFFKDISIFLGFSKEHNDKIEIHKIATAVVKSLDRNYTVEQQGKILRLVVRKMLNKRIEQIRENQAMLDEFKVDYEQLTKL